jgi:hypothetical protein
MKQSARPLLFFFCLLLLVPAILCAESLHIRKPHVADLNAAEPVSILVALDEAIRIVLPADRTFLRAVELEIKIPPELTRSQAALTYAFYQDITPPLSEFITEYQGSLVYAAPLPNRVGLTVGIPYGDSGVLQVTPYLSIVPVSMGEQTESIFFLLRQFPQNSRASPDLTGIQLSVAIKPVFESKGFLALSVQYRQGGELKPAGHPYTIFIDTQSIAPGFEKIVLDTGLHHLAIVSNFYRNVVKTFVISQGKTSSLDIELMDISPTVLITAPEVSEIFLDGAPIILGFEPLPLEQGEHSLRVLLGGYEVLRTIYVENGKSYRISVFFDAEIEEIR